MIAPTFFSDPSVKTMETVETPDIEVSQDPSETPLEVTEARPKVPRTQKQMDALENARKRAMQVRSERAELKSKEREIVRTQMEMERKAKADRIRSEYDAMQRVDAEEEEEPAPPAPPTKKARKPARRIIVHEVSSASESEDDTVDVILPKERKKPTAAEAGYRRTMDKMFTFG